MYLTYNKLWKLLIDKGMNKTDLCEITGISSRTMAKLSKNQSVTTDTLVNICSALRCDITDIMEMVGDDPGSSLYEAYLAAQHRAETNERFTVTRLEHKGKAFAIYKTVRKATRYTKVDCCDGLVNWTQYHPSGRHGVFYDSPVTNRLFSMGEWEAGVITVIVISGKAYDIRGLDEYEFYSSRRVPDKDKYVYLMSEAVFKLFEPVHEFE